MMEYRQAFEGCFPARGPQSE
ncbi:hypothetical protein LCGC14_2914680, partial [marine sediment metagenome]